MPLPSLPATLSPHSVKYLLHIQNRAHSLPPLSVGEVVQATVVGKGGGKGVFLDVKGARILAESALFLKGGTKGLVRVEQLRPRVILRILQSGGEIPPRPLSSDSKDFLNIFMNGGRELGQEGLGEVVSYLGKQDLEDIRSMIRSLVFSEQSTQNPLFLKEYVHRIGYLLEGTLKKLLERKPVSNKSDVKSLKALLLRISNRLDILEKNPKAPGMEKIARFVRSSLSAIESQQATNCLLQSSDDTYSFQIPLQFPGKLGMAEIVVEFDHEDSADKGKRKRRKILFLLRMDALGDVVVETGITQKDIACVVKCRNEDVCVFIAPHLKELEGALTALGYRVVSLACVLDQGETKKDRQTFRCLSDREIIDLRA